MISRLRGTTQRIRAIVRVSRVQAMSTTASRATVGRAPEKSGKVSAEEGFEGRAAGYEDAYVDFDGGPVVGANEGPGWVSGVNECF